IKLRMINTTNISAPEAAEGEVISEEAGTIVDHLGTTHISLYVNQSMLCDPWKDLTELLEPRMRKSIDPKPTESADTSANDSRTSINTSASNNEVTEQVTEDSLLISDTSGNVSDQIIEECTPTKCSTTPTVQET
ncbi:hypothetical protein GE061_007896, partial [Apolygus lucorum]